MAGLSCSLLNENAFSCSVRTLRTLRCGITICGLHSKVWFLSHFSAPTVIDHSWHSRNVYGVSLSCKLLNFPKRRLTKEEGRKEEKREGGRSIKVRGGRKRSPQMEAHAAKEAEESQGQIDLFSRVVEN